MTNELPRIDKLYDLSGQVAIVTGAAEGMGREIARYLAAAGADVAVADINRPGAEQAAAEINDGGGRGRAYDLDQSKEDSVVDMVSAVRRDMGGLHILVNNAGIQDREVLENTSVALWDKLQAVNLRGPFLCVREAARVMRADGTRGRIINISSMGSLHPIFEGLVAYNATKAGINALTRNAAFELAEDGITVNAVLPGATPTEGQARAPGPPVDEETIRHMMPPLGRAGTPGDIANAVLFFAAPGASHVTAQFLVVDGGHLNR